MWNCKYALEYVNQFMKYLWFHDVLLNLSVSGIWDSSSMTIPQRKEDLTRSLDTGWVLVTTPRLRTLSRSFMIMKDLG